MACRILFATWDGPQVHYLESLFLPIFERLEPHGVHFDVLQFRWGDPVHTVRIAKRCRSAGIEYRPALVQRAPPVAGPFATAILGAREVRTAARDFRSDVVMPRSLMPALAVLLAHKSETWPIVYDADGLEADERVDFRGMSPSNPVYRLLRKIERSAVREASSVLVRTSEAADILAKRASVDRNRFHLVTNGRDPRVFQPATSEERRRARSELAFAEDAPVLVYSGSIGPQYRLDRVAATFMALRKRSPGAQLLMLTPEPSRAIDLLEGHAPGISRSTQALSVNPERVPYFLGAADAGLSFRSEAFSTRAIAPVKLGEYLLCGLPVVGTAGLGGRKIDADVFLVDSAGPDGAAEWLLHQVLPNRKTVAARARAIGTEFFSLDASVGDYLKALAPFSEGFSPFASDD